MSRLDSEHRMCWEKRKHRSEEAAMRFAKKTKYLNGKQFRCYQCPYCGKYHLTKQEKKNESVGGELDSKRKPWE